MENIIFLTMSNIQGLGNHGIYSDLIRKFRDEGHQVTIVTPRERRLGEQTSLKEVDGVQILGVRTLNLQKTNAIEKGIGQVMVERLFKQAIKKHLCNVKTDLILYSTPPITFPKVIQYLKKSNPQAKTYLLLKDIFPQNAVDLGMMSKSGVKGVLYRFFRKKEKKLYLWGYLSDSFTRTYIPDVKVVVLRPDSSLVDSAQISNGYGSFKSSEYYVQVPAKPKT